MWVKVNGNVWLWAAVGCGKKRESLMKSDILSQVSFNYELSQHVNDCLDLGLFEVCYLKDTTFNVE